ncbi:hypothetical protein IFM89_007178 [Coptis chinensis]|uniref:Endonuclease/exonuclease/phosphatase domain-containing protein n=1 Tax=Coptis chinensis TaxID=261450 RepID=A0A835LIK0_9MAGN|nr:hypothetical protein IFM89_007178 [Coptis chinensis]
MNTLYWNARGVKRQKPWYHIEELVLSHNPDFLCIAEPLIKPPNVLPPLLSKHGFSANFLHNNTPNRKLTLLGQSGQAWAVIGDSNIVTSISERKGWYSVYLGNG